MGDAKRLAEILMRLAGALFAIYVICVVGFVFWNILFLLLLTLVSITLKQTKLKQRY